jgi:hypothetical protein
MFNTCRSLMLTYWIFLDNRAILHNPEAYPDPHTFKPERYILSDGTVKDDPALGCAFGLGRRYGQDPGPASA